VVAPVNKRLRALFLILDIFPDHLFHARRPPGLSSLGGGLGLPDAAALQHWGKHHGNGSATGRVVCALYEIDLRTSAIIEIFFADCTHARSRTVNIYSPERLQNGKPPIMCQACDMDAPLPDDTA
jgi:hypothetical protein